MTDRTCLDVAAEAICTNTGRCFVGETHRIQAETALDAIHPALAQLTPDDVRELIDYRTAMIKAGMWKVVP